MLVQRRSDIPYGLLVALVAACTSSARSDMQPSLDGFTHAGGVVSSGGHAAPATAAWRPDAWLARLPAPDNAAPFFLSEAGLYQDVASKVVHVAAVEFSPEFPLWSDGTQKQRWLLLPELSAIDASQPDHWLFPVGTFVFKEFRAGERRLETRLLARTGPGLEDYWMGSFLWNEDESDARFVRDGGIAVLGTQHDVPSVRQCGTCHRGAPARYLGISPIQTPQLPAGLIVPAAQPAFRPPGDLVEARALGYLHGNCAHCHSPYGSARPDTDLDLRLLPSDRLVHETQIYASTFDVPLQYFDAAPGARRVVPGDPANSVVLLRMLERGNRTQMPPLGTRVIDPIGTMAIQAWINQL